MSGKLLTVSFLSFADDRVSVETRASPSRVTRESRGLNGNRSGLRERLPVHAALSTAAVGTRISPKSCVSVNEAGSHATHETVFASEEIIRAAHAAQRLPGDVARAFVSEGGANEDVKPTVFFVAGRVFFGVSKERDRDPPTEEEASRPAPALRPRLILRAAPTTFAARLKAPDGFFFPVRSEPSSPAARAVSSALRVAARAMPIASSARASASETFASSSFASNSARSARSESARVASAAAVPSALSAATRLLFLSRSTCNRRSASIARR